MTVLPIKFYLPKLAVFRCLNITATENTERSKGTITNQGSSGTAGVCVLIGDVIGVGEGAGEDRAASEGMDTSSVCVVLHPLA